MTKVVLDIETVGVEWDNLDGEAKDYLLKYADTEEKKEDVIKKLGLWAPTGKVVVIGMLNPDSKKAFLLYEDPLKTEIAESKIESFAVSYHGGSEADILKKFWEIIPRYQRFITFNGRGFDCPFLMLRSMIHGIEITRNLSTRRYSITPHCDIMDVLTFFGAIRRFNLEFWCRTLGIRSSKSQHINGSMVKEAYRDGKIMDIVHYCFRDLIATFELYNILERTVLKVMD